MHYRFDDSDCYSYPEKIILALADHSLDTVCKGVVSKLKSITAGMQSPEDSGLENIWDEICVQLQTDHSIHWDLYEELVESVIEDMLFELPEYVRAAIQYSYDFNDYDSIEEYDKNSDMDVLTEIVKNAAYDIATRDHSPNVKRYLEDHEEL